MSAKISTMVPKQHICLLNYPMLLRKGGNNYADKLLFQMLSQIFTHLSFVTKIFSYHHNKKLNINSSVRVRLKVFLLLKIPMLKFSVSNDGENFVSLSTSYQYLKIKKENNITIQGFSLNTIKVHRSNILFIFHYKIVTLSSTTLLYKK